MRVVITSVGVVAPNGQSADRFFKTRCDGKSAGAPVKRFDTSAWPTKIACEIDRLEYEGYLTAKEYRRLDDSNRDGHDAL